ncbi:MULTISPECIES: DNA-directed RNA polymerase [Sulfolobaceae]|uniref:DNA-directed RNA polymerase subunit Rpo7 n=2 Tax=Sulfurisphaera tokodaii TaxID=111955 RepID=Q975P0_SULTO|nr:MULTISPECIES: DNA-directed RNA polymerase [Sulfolobaceae]QIW23229.1 DNA-directed RNA polymerase [Sulfolobus sp. S-194]BAB65360.1 DNA-directed RNA polymerase subunit E' [Sulfurisphaera tokodaii str. 7]HII74941.1 DNA-directed RNA polymerase [Sulfurisphaera tokodaii]
MFKLIKAKGIIRIPPEYFGQPLDEIALQILRQEYQEKMIKDLGLVLAVLDAKVSEEGYIIFGDGATYHEVSFEMLAFVPIIQEVVEGEVNQVDNYGVYVNIGPVDGLAHISQITDDNLKFDQNRGILIGERSKKIIQKGDRVRARIISVSTSGGRMPRIALTMKQPYLGKIEWISQELTKASK